MNEVTTYQNNSPAQVPAVTNPPNLQPSVLANDKANTGVLDASMEQLRREWGPHARAKVAMVEDLIGSAPAPVADALLNARHPDGSMLFSHASVIKWIVGLLVGDVEVDLPAAGIQEKINAIEKVMRTDRRRYNADVEMQERYLQLLRMRG